MPHLLSRVFKSLLGTIAVLFGLHACTQQSVYQLLQEHERQDCELQPIALQKSCREQYEMDYAEYERLRNQEGLTEKR